MLTEYERDILESVKDGKDVFEHGIANACLLLERKGLVEMTPLSYEHVSGHGTKAVAFHAKATVAGMEALNAG